jgi:hypothetical protein
VVSAACTFAVAQFAWVGLLPCMHRGPDWLR